MPQTSRRPGWTTVGGGSSQVWHREERPVGGGSPDGPASENSTVGRVSRVSRGNEVDYRKGTKNEERKGEASEMLQKLGRRGFSSKPNALEPHVQGPQAASAPPG